MIYILSAILGIASWYGAELEGRSTASGEPFDPEGLTAACWHYPIGTLLEVTNADTGESVVVRVNDRGPAKRLGRLIDLSHASFAEIADPDRGLLRVRVQALNGPDSEEKTASAAAAPPRSADP